MRDSILSIFILFSILTGCSSNSGDKKTGSNTVENARSDSTKVSVPRYLTDSLSDLKSFNINTNYPPLDSIIRNMTHRKSIQITIKSDYCWGDCCGAYKKYDDKSDGATLYIFKADGGEYGFSNDEYFFHDKSLLMTRSYVYGVEIFPTDTAPTLFYIEEQVCDFSKDEILVMHRKKTFTDNNNYTIDDLPFTISAGERTLISDKMEQFKTILNYENSKPEYESKEE